MVQFRVSILKNFHIIVVHREQLSTHNLEFSFASKFSGRYKYCFVLALLHVSHCASVFLC